MRTAWWFAGVLVGCSTAAEGDEISSAGGTTTAEPTGETGLDESTGETSAAPGPTTSGEDTGVTGSGGCGVDPGVRGVDERTLEVAGVERRYLVVVPAGYDPGQAYALVFAWHGRGGSGAFARTHFGIEEAAMGQAVVVYPDGLPQADMEGQTGWDLMKNGEDLEFFDAMLAEVGGTLCVDPGRVFSAGHSFGGFMSNAVGCYRGGVVRGIAAVSGGGPFLQCTGQVAAWIAHGTLDEVVPFASGEQSRDHWTAANGCSDQADPVDPPPCAAFAGCDAGFPVTWCAHDDPELTGHAWPAWAGAGIWGFFAAL
jgi:poly(3-hydroxybutyrate) depolymerase